MEPLQRKTIQVALKATDDAGSFEAVIATLGVIDHDGDVVEAGALDGQTVSLMPAHDSMSVPLGKATIVERGNDVVAVGKFNREVSAGKDWHEAIKFDLEHPPAKQEWSWGYRVKKENQRLGQLNGEDVRFLSLIDVEEISPVLKGASIGTRTLAAKAQDQKIATSDESWDPVMQFFDRRGQVGLDAYASGGGNALSEKDHVLGEQECFAHHFVLFGKVGPASTRACLYQIARMNTGESFVSNREKVYDHLAGHLKDAGIDPPDLQPADKPGLRLVDQVRMVAWRAESAVDRLQAIEAKGKGGLSDAAKAEAIEMSSVVGEMTALSTKLAELVDELAPEDEVVALALAGYRAGEARRRLTG